MRSTPIVGTGKERMTDFQSLYQRLQNEIAAKSEDRFVLADYLDLHKPELTALTEQVKLAVEQGVSEAKASMLLKIIHFFDELGYDYRNISQKTQILSKLSQLIFLLGIEYQFTKGKLQVHYKSEVHETRQERKNLKTIVQDISGRIQANPALERDQRVKIILMQLKIYKNELSKLQELLPNLPPDKQAGIKQNFAKKIEEVTDKMNIQYEDLTRDEKEARGEIKRSKSIEDFSLRELGPIIGKQRNICAAYLAALRTIETEGYGISQIIQKIAHLGDEVKKLVSAQASLLREKDKDLPRLYHREIVFQIEKTCSSLDY
jgi:hypothetical protein